MPDIVIIPQRGTSNNPSMHFTGSALANIRMEVLPSGSISFIGTSGSLFNVTDNLLGSLMSVGDVSGLPILEVFSDDRVVMGRYGKNTVYVSGTNVGIGKVPANAVFDVSGSAAISGSATVTGSFTANGRVTFNNGGTGGNGTLTVAGDITTYRSSNTGVLYFGSGQNNYIYYDGTNYNMPGGNLYLNGNYNLYFSAWGGGWYMQDSTWIRSVNSKSVWVDSGVLGGQGGLTLGYGGGSPPSAGAIISGCVGIGTSTPSGSLEVKSNGPAIVINGTTISSYKGIEIQGNGTTYGEIKQNAGNGDFRITSGRENYVGFFMTFYTDNSERMRITSGGNVGIGQSIPTAKLEVSGDVMADNVLNPFLLMGA